MAYKGSRYGNRVAKHYSSADLGVDATITIAAAAEFFFPFIAITEYSKMQWIMEIELDAGTGPVTVNPLLPNLAKDSEGLLIEGQTTIPGYSGPVYNSFLTGVQGVNTVNRSLTLTYNLKGPSFLPTPGFYAEYVLENITAVGSSPFPAILATQFTVGIVNNHISRDIFINNPRCILFD